MTDSSPTPRVGVDPYLEWLGREGLPVVEDFGVDLLGVQTAPWARYDANGAAVHLKGRGDFLCMLVIDIPPGKATAPLHHLYEAVFYVLSGRGDIAPVTHIKDIIVQPKHVLHIDETVPGEGELDIGRLLRRFHALYPHGYGLIEHLSIDKVPLANMNVRRIAAECGVPIV